MAKEPWLQLPWIVLNTVGGRASEPWPVRVRADRISALRPNVYEGLTKVWLQGGGTLEVLECGAVIECRMSVALANAGYVHLDMPDAPRRRVA